VASGCSIAINNSTASGDCEPERDRRPVPPAPPAPPAVRVTPPAGGGGGGAGGAAAPARAGAIAFTGGEIEGMAGAAAAATALGSALLGLGRRKQTEGDDQENGEEGVD
jgi:hypothetical protein